MPSLSESFPTIGLLVSGTRKLFSRSKKQPPVEITDAPENLFADDSPSPESEDAADLAQIAYQAGAEEIASEIEEPDGYTLEAPTPVDPPFTQGPDPIATGSARNLPSALEESPTIPGLYETWVELEERVKRAQNELQAILATREEAAILRGRAQKRLDEGESIRADVARISESAWRAFARGFAVSAKGLPNRWTTVREIDEAMRTHTALQRATHSESWQEADRTRQRATTELLKALAVLNTAMAQAQRQLKEAANLPSVADALMQSAQEELRCAQAIRSELLLLGKEALNELDAPPYVHQPGPQEITISDPQDFAAGFLADAGLLGATPPVISEPQRVPPSAPVVEPSQAAPSLSDALSGQASVAWESPKEAEPAAVPEPETPNHEIREQVGPRMGGGFEAPEPPAAPAPPEPAPIPQPTFEAPEAAPPSDWFTQAPTNAEPSTIPQLPSEVPEAAPPSAWFTEEKPLQQNETPVPQAPPAAPPPTAPPVQAPSEAQILEEEIAAATPASESLGSAAAAMAEELARGMGGVGVSPGTGEPPERIVIEAAQPPVPEAPAPPVEPQGVVIEMISSAQRGRAVAPGYGGRYAAAGTGTSSRARRCGRPEPANHRDA